MSAPFPDNALRTGFLFEDGGSVKNEILDLLSFITLVNELIKCEIDQLNVCNEVCVNLLPTVSSVCVNRQRSV